MKKIVILIFLMVVLLPQAYSLGVSPARKIINFEEGLNVSGSIRIINTGHKDMKVVILAEGNLSEYVKVNNGSFSFKAYENEKLVSYVVNLPRKIGKPGDHDIELVVMEIPESGVEARTIVKAITSVISQIRIKVPYPGTYAEADLHIRVLDDDVLITIPISNLGTKDFKANARIKIIKGEEELAEFITDVVEIKAKDSSKITAHWSAPSIGAYKVVAELNYGKVIKLQKDFRVGDKFVKIVDIVVGDFKLGDVVKFDIIVQNGWNELIEDVWCEVFVRDKDGYTVAVLKTASEDIDALSRKELTAYWDTKGIEAGVYDLFIKLYYAGKYSEKKIKISAGEDLIGKVIEVPRPMKTNVVVVVVILAGIGLIVGFVYFRKRNKEVEEFENELENFDYQNKL